MVDHASATGDELTLRDVIMHMQHMEQRLSAKIEQNTRDITRNDQSICALSVRVDTMEIRLTQRIDALEEDLVATMKDSLHIRRHVGMTVPDEG